jgi:hypothetical protein
LRAGADRTAVRAGKEKDPEAEERRRRLAAEKRAAAPRDDEAAKERARLRAQSQGRSGGRTRRSFAAMAEAPGAAKKESRSASSPKDDSAAKEAEKEKARAELEEKKRELVRHCCSLLNPSCIVLVVCTCLPRVTLCWH